MGTQRRTVLLAFGVWSIAFAIVAAAPAFSEVSVNINIGPPPVVVHQPPEMVVVPGSMVYFAPGVQVELFFYRGYWWSRHEGRYFRSRDYNGPWTHMGPRYVPVEIVRLPRGYREVHARHDRIPYGHLKKHWEHREYERRKRVGEWKDWKEEKRERKEEKREHKRESKEHRKEHKEREKEHGGHGRGR